MVGGTTDTNMSLQVQPGQPRRYGDVPLMVPMQSARDAEEERDRMGHNIRER